MRTDIDGQVVWKGDYAPFGETLEEQPVTWGSQYKFLGNEDDGGLMDFGARFYDPRVGRFISPDPIKDASSANVVNPYAYCSNNPLRYTDKFGLSAAPAPIIKSGDEISAGGGGGHTTASDPQNLWDDMGGEIPDPDPGSGGGGGGGGSNPGGQAAQGAKRNMNGASRGAGLTVSNDTYGDVSGPGGDPSLVVMPLEEEQTSPDAMLYTEAVVTKEAGKYGDKAEFIYYEHGKRNDLINKIEGTETVENGGKFDRMLIWGHGGEQGVGGFTRAQVRGIAETYVKEGGEIYVVGCGQNISDWKKTFEGSSIRVAGVYPGYGLYVTNMQIYNYVINTVGRRHVRITGE